MANIDTEREQYTHTAGLSATPSGFDFEVDPQMDDHDLLIHHVAEHDSELYALDCCLGEMLGV